MSDPVRTPTWRYMPLVVTVVPNTPAASATTTAWPLGTVWLESVHLTVPRGHAGLTGLAIIDAGQRIVPYSDAVNWIIADSFDEDFALGMQVSPALSVRAFNTDTVYSHAFYLRAQVRNLDLTGGALPASAVPVF
jgi:hypothetical protein